MPDQTDILGLPFILPAQAQKHVTHNEALLQLDVLVQLAVLDRDRSAPPALPALGDRHIVAEVASFDWAGQSGKIAVYRETGWQFLAPLAGWRAQILAEGQEAVFDGSAWLAGDAVTARFGRLGVATSADATNRLAVASPAVLLTHAGEGVQLKLNKAAAGETASLLFQTAWSGRAEMGTAGADDFAIKVSDDGATWHTGLSIDAASGAVTVPQSLEAVALRQNGSAVLSRATLLGPVAMTAGLPSGAVLERGSTADGDYLRFADGTQICWHGGLSVANVSTAEGAGFRSALLGWTFPKAFLAGSLPVVTGQSADAGCWFAAAAPSVTAVQVRALSFASRASSLGLRALAVGRWA